MSRWSRPGQGQPAAEADSRWRGRGQVLVIFAGALVALMMFMAMVVDIGWYWSSGLKLQRAADAAALAGAVWLPCATPLVNGTCPAGDAAAQAAAKRNGYVPDSDTTLTSAVDGSNPRQLDVTITDKVGTFFLRVVGIKTLDASRSSKAEFVLPVPMGSPLSYYGVGTFVGLVTPTLTTNYVNPTAAAASPSSGWAIPSAVGTGVWASATSAYTSNNVYATETTNGDAQIWKTFNFGSFAAGAQIDGLQLGLELKDDDATGCRVKAEVSWNNGGNWSNLAQQTSDITASDAWYTLGVGTDAVWDSTHPSWSTGDFSAANFQVRLTYVKPAACTGTVSLDQVSAKVYSHTDTPGTPVETTMPVANPIGSPPIPVPTSQGFWGAAITKGGSRGNGDQFDPAKDGSSANPDYTGLGVDYNVVITGSAGQVQIFDPTFCETGTNSSSSGHYGAGDHWINNVHNGVTTTYTLYDQKGTPYYIGDDKQMATSGNLFADEIQSDQSGDMGSPTTGVNDCSASAISTNPAVGGYYHNRWYQLASGLPAGTYRLNVSTDTGNTLTNAENGWSLLASSTGGTAQIYGQGQMVAYTNLIAGTSRFYLAQIDKVHAGKTLEIHVFDPDSMTGTMRILSPDNNTQTYLNFNWTADNGQIGTGSSIAITPNGFNDVLLTITIPLPTTYGSGGLWQNGWWQIEYNVGGGNDTTTWAVDIRGNPVHLLVP